MVGVRRRLQLASRSVGSFDGEVLIHELHGWFIEGITIHMPVPTVRMESLGDDTSTQRVTAALATLSVEDYCAPLSSLR